MTIRPGIAIALALVVAKSAAAQRGGYERRSERFSSLGLMAGTATSNFEAKGNGFAGAFSVSIPSGRIFVVEPGVGWFSYRSVFGDRITYILPEISLQAEPPRGALRPYAGVGAGFTEYLSGRGTTFGSLHAAVGIRANLGDRFGFRAEVRARSIDPFNQSTTDYLIGLTKRLSTR